MTTAVLPRFVRHSPIAFAMTVLLTLMVAVIEVPTAAPPHVQAFVAAA